MEAINMKFFPRTTSLFDVFDDVFDMPWFNGTNDFNMKTDISEKDGSYLLDMELPGYQKEDINIELNNGYLNVTASRNHNNEEKDDKGNLIRQERYSGSCTRNFYVGNYVKEEDIKANFENGELKICVPKVETQIPEKKTIMIE